MFTLQIIDYRWICRNDILSDLWRVLIRADILKRSEADPRAWELIEVKSASNGESGRRAKLKKSRKPFLCARL